MTEFNLNVVDLLIERPEVKMALVYRLYPFMEIKHGSYLDKKMYTVSIKYDIPTPIDQDLVISLGSDERSNIQLIGEDPLIENIKNQGLGEDRGRLGYFYSISGDKWKFKQVYDPSKLKEIIMSKTTKSSEFSLEKVLKHNEKVVMDDDTAIGLSLTLLGEEVPYEIDAAVFFKP